jgi:CheY-like chemotaxis protein
MSTTPLMAQPSPTGVYPTLTGLEVFIVEDEWLISRLIEELLEELGCTVADSAGSVAEALAKLNSGVELDVAVLDVRLSGQLVFPVADVLASRNIPIVFATGYGTVDLPERYPGRPILHKPYGAGDLAEALMAITCDPLN